MPRSQQTGRLGTAACLAIAVALISGSVTQAQDDTWRSPYPLILTSARAAAFAQAAAEHLDYVPGEVLVKFRRGTSLLARNRALSALRSRPTSDRLRWLGDVAVVKEPREDDATVIAAQLSRQPEVEWAEPNFLSRISTTPNDPGFSDRQWNFSAIDVPRAWDINPGGSPDTTVAVLDTGITSVTDSFVFPTWNGRAIQNVSIPYRQSPEFAAARLRGARDFVFWEGPVLDMVGHGTHVSATIGEEANNAVAEAGMAYNVTLMPVKVCVGYWEIQFMMSAAGQRGYAPVGIGLCDSAAIIEGIRYAADNGADVINLSLGGVGRSTGGVGRSTAELEALRYAVSKGVFVAIAGGNEYEEGNPVEYPAAFAPEIDGVMSVGAVGRSLERAFYSNTGAHIEITAPGGDEFDGGDDGLIWQATLFAPDFDEERVIIPRFDRYAETPEQGTSMASPHVAGMAALIIGQGITNPAAVEALIKATAKDLGKPGRDDEFGQGLIQPRAALYGFGLAR
jgi:serine protease